MFGYHKLKRENAQAKHELKTHRQLPKEITPEEEEKHVKQKSEQAKAERDVSRKEGVAYAESHFNKPQQGLSPKVRSAMQHEAERGIKRHSQAAERKLLGEQSRHGIRGKSGVAFAQRKDLHKADQEARGAAHRDLEKLDYDTALKLKAASFGVGEGSAIQSQLDKQIAADELKLNHERKRQRVYENQRNREFSRI